MNPFQPLYDRCNARKGPLQNGPIMVDLEPVGLCNFRCTMCPTGLQSLGRPGGFMTTETHQAVLEKTEGAIRYIGWGEPLMHPKIVRFVETASQRGRLTHINTNASKLTPRLASQLVQAGLSSIKFSFQGTDRETYAMMRRTDFFAGMLEKIAMMRETRDYLASDMWIAASTSTTDETPEMVEVFREKLEPLVDQLSIGKTIFEFIDLAAVPQKHRERLEAAAKKSQVQKRHPNPCPEVFDKLTIHWDGAVRVCCNDYSGRTNLGNINRDAMEDIWRHPKMTAYRKRLSEGRYDGPLCGNCWDYMDLTSGVEDEIPQAMAG